MRITFKQLIVFIAIAQRENITLAAEEVHLSQPAVSMALGELEKQLDIPLFDRIGKRLILNHNGRELLPKAVEIIDRMKQVENMFHESTGQISGSLRIGASLTIGNYVLPDLIMKFKALYPFVNISLDVANSEKIITDLIQCNLDMGFIEGSCHAKELNIKSWKKDELIVFASSKNKLAKKEKLQLGDIQKADWIMRERGSGTREVIEKHIKLEQVSLELGSVEAIKLAVQQGNYISCLSRVAIEQELKAKKIVQLNVEHLSIKRDFFMLTHKAKYNSDILNAFRKI